MECKDEIVAPSCHRLPHKIYANKISNPPAEYNKHTHTQTHERRYSYTVTVTNTVLAHIT